MSPEVFSVPSDGLKICYVCLLGFTHCFRVRHNHFHFNGSIFIPVCVRKKVKDVART